MTTLNDLPIGKTATVAAVGGEGSLRQHFLDMGIIPLVDVTMVKHAPMGDPIEVRIHSYELTLRRDDARNIEIDDVRDGADVRESRASGKPVPHPGLGEGGKFHDRAGENPLPEGTPLTFALVGNQNCGKTTLFNQLTGSNQHVGNFPGVTVDRKDGCIKGHPEALVTDLPGIYSMSPYTSEELVTRAFLLDEHPHGIINIVDATNIERERDPYVRIRLHRMRSVRKAPDDGATRRQMPEVRHPQRAGCNPLLIVRRGIRRPRRPRIESRRQSEGSPIAARRRPLDSVAAGRHSKRPPR